MENSTRKVRRYQLSNVSKIEDIPPNGTFMLADALLQTETIKPVSGATEGFQSSVEQSEAISSPDKVSEDFTSSNKVRFESGEKPDKHKLKDWESSPNFHTIVEPEQSSNVTIEVQAPQTTTVVAESTSEGAASQTLDLGAERIPTENPLKLSPHRIVFNTDRSMSVGLDSSVMTPGFQKNSMEIPLESPPEKSDLKFVLEVPNEETPKVVSHQLTFYVNEPRADSQELKLQPVKEEVDRLQPHEIIRLQPLSVKEQIPNEPLKPLVFTPYASRQGSNRAIPLSENEPAKDLTGSATQKDEGNAGDELAERECLDSPGKALSINPGNRQESNDIESPVLPHNRKIVDQPTAQGRKILVKNSTIDRHMRPVSMPLIPGESPVGSLRMDIPQTDQTRSVVNHGSNNIQESAPKSPSNGPSERDLSRKNSRSVIGSTKGKADEYSRKNVNRMKMHLEETVRHNRIFRGNSVMDFDDSKSVKSQILNEDRMKKRLQEQFPKGDAFLDNDSVRSWDLNDEQANLTQLKKESQVVDTSTLLKKQMTKRASDGEIEMPRFPLGDSKLMRGHTFNATSRPVSSGPVYPKLLALVMGIFLFEALRAFIRTPVH